MTYHDIAQFGSFILIGNVYFIIKDDYIPKYMGGKGSIGHTVIGK